MTILIIALIVFAIAVAVWFIRAFQITRAMEKLSHQRTMRDHERDELMKEPWPPAGGAMA